MSNFIFAITERELDPPEINKLKSENINIKDYSPEVRDGRIGHYYYEISSNKCEATITNKKTINPYNKIDEVEDAFSSLHETGVFRLLMLDEEKDTHTLSRLQDGEFETTIKHFPQEKVQLSEALEKYPQALETNRVYIVD
jgi:phage terminase large subunit-like protein